MKNFHYYQFREITNSYKFPRELNRPASPSLGIATPTIEHASSLEAAISITSQIQESGDLLLDHKCSQTIHIIKLE